MGEMINTTREGYRSVATRGSIIYFVIANMALIDPMYQYSLQFFKSLFVQRLERSEKNDDVQMRLEILLSDITMSMYNNICRGLLEKDKLLFSFIIAANIARHAGIISPAEWKCIMVGPGVPDAATLEAKPAPNDVPWLVTGLTWGTLLMMEKSMPDVFTGLPDSIVQDASRWQSEVIDSEFPQYAKLPGGWEDKLTNFQKLLVLRALREEKAVFGVREFVAKELGKVFTESPAFNLEACYADSNKVTPLIFILSSGADPNDYLIALAKDKGKRLNENLRIISLGQGQGPIAEALFKQGRQTGDWVCLQNCHLAVSWLPKMEAMLEDAGNDPGSTHDDFRLWLTSSPSSKFPVPVLQV